LIDYHRFFEEIEDFLVPPTMTERHFESFCKNTMEHYRGVRYSNIEFSDLYAFMYGMTRQLSPAKGKDSFYLQGMRISDIACSELIARRHDGTLLPSPAALMQFTSLEWMVEENVKSPGQNTEILRLLSGTEGVWDGDRFIPSEGAQAQTRFLLSYVFGMLMMISDYQLDQYRKIPLQIGALYRLKGQAAAENEVGKLMKHIESRPGSRPYVVKALMDSRLPAAVYMRQLKNNERGQALDLALGL
jgi:hypothetical protein